jgi:hypothetical protein
VTIVAVCIAFSNVSDASNNNTARFQAYSNMNMSVIPYASFVKTAMEKLTDTAGSIPEKLGSGSMSMAQMIPFFVPFYFFGFGFLLMVKKGWIQVKRRDDMYSRER